MLTNKFMDSFPDFEVKTAINALPGVPLEDRTFFHEMMVDRKHMLLSACANIPPDKRAALQRIDPLLRIRPDYWTGQWAVERLSPSERAWMVVTMWPVAHPEYTFDVLLEQLRYSDMQRWDSTADYLRHKREQAQRIRDANEKKGTEKVLAAVDALPARRVDEFLAAERALRTGERIHLRGKDADTLNRMYDRSRSTPVPEGLPTDTGPINPGMAPGNYHRQPR